MSTWVHSHETRTASAAAPEALCYEILPVTLHTGQIVYVQRYDDIARAWYEPYIAAAHPSRVVRACVEAFFGRALDPSATVVHSTAWRYESGAHASGRLILTYLAVLPPIACISQLKAASPIRLEPVGGVAPARSSTLAPPDQITLQHVLAHALDHLRLLIETDPPIARAIGPLWRAALDCRERRPAGELQRLAPAGEYARSGSLATTQ